MAPISTWSILLIYKLSRHTMSSSNMLTTLCYVGQHSSVDISQEYDNICSWSVRNKLTINTGKTKKIVFHRPATRHLNIPPPLTDIERVSQATLPGIDITPTLSTSVYVNKMLTQINQRLYLLSQLKLQGLNIQALHTLFTGLIMSKSRRSCMHYLPLQFNLPLTINTGWAPYHEKLYDTVSILTLTLTKSQAAR